MSRSLGLREDQQAAEALLAWIVGLLPEAPWGGHREQARAYRYCAVPCRSELARDRAGPAATMLQVMTASGAFKPAAGSPASKGVD
ncbi:hypothetical protein C1Y35_10260 [Pseudomonas sp. GW456-L14]|nr:hypothetical protein C1Y35_10260 [Pseudomonas sp. GW456-L14]PMY56325.1 hypothetical protein C1Y34_13055 [Pseudomonas sp. GW456-L12]